MAHVRNSKDIMDLVFSFYDVGPEDKTQIMKLGNKYLYHLG